jgi:hypothetical protein
VPVARSHAVAHGRAGVLVVGRLRVALWIDELAAHQRDAEDGGQQGGEGGNAPRGVHHATRR